MILQVQKADYIKDYVMRVMFNDGTAGDVDLKETIYNDSRAIFKELKDLSCFTKFTVSLNTICWMNGLDIAPEYLKSILLEQQQVAVES